MSGNFVQISRKVLKDEVIMTDGDYFAVYMFLMLNVTHTEQPKKFKGEWITLKPGQGIFGREDIAKKLKIHESKIQRILTKFKNEQLIEQQTSNQNRLVTMIFWDYKGDSEQLNEQRMNNECTTDEQRMNTNNKEKKEKKEKKEDNINNSLELSLVEEEKIGYTETIYLTEKQYQKIVKDYEYELDFIESEFKNATLWMLEPTHLKKWKNKDINLFIRRWMNKTFKDYLYKKEIRNKNKNNSQSKIEMANAGRSQNIQNTLFLDGGI